MVTLCSIHTLVNSLIFAYYDGHQNTPYRKTAKIGIDKQTSRVRDVGKRLVDRPIDDALLFALPSIVHVSDSFYFSQYGGAKGFCC